MNLKIPTDNRGQTIVALLFFTIITIIITTAAILVLISNSLGATKWQEGTLAYYAAEAGVENALLQLLRNPQYEGEEMQLDASSSVTINVSGDNPKIITALGKSGNFVRKIIVNIIYNNNILEVSSWRETP